MAAIAVKGVGLVTSVGLTMADSCAAFRAKVSNPTRTEFIDSSGTPVMAHQVPLHGAARGMHKLALMATMSVQEALQDVPKESWGSLPLLLCVAEPERPGRQQGLEERLFGMIEDRLDAGFSQHSAVMPHGRVAVAVALAQARAILSERKATQVVIATADSFITWPSLRHYEQNDRLLTERNPNGFMPGEGAGALLIGNGEPGELHIAGIGFGRDSAHIESTQPLRGDGLTAAIKSALRDAELEMHEIDYRVAGVSGEQYFFKEASLAFDRSLRVREHSAELWHPAESAGETGAAAGALCAALSFSAAAKRFSKGPAALVHLSNDREARAAIVFRMR